MKTVQRAILLVFLTMAASRLSAQTGNPHEMVVPLTDPGKPVTLKTRLLSGSIKVVGYEGKDVIVSFSIDSSKSRDEEGGGMKRINTTGDIDVRATEHDNTVDVNCDGPGTRVSGLTIKVPQNTAAIEIGTVNGGDISVSNVSGKIELENVNGGITAKDVSGSVVANTVNGNVIVTFRSVDPTAAMAFSSLNGRVDVSFPAEYKANLKLKAGNGEIFTDFDFKVENNQTKTETRNEKHFHEVKIDDWAYGKINGGGPEIMMQSTFGPVYIRKTK